MKGTRDWCCRKRQHIYIFLQLLDLLLVLDTKALFLVNDQKPQIFEFHIITEHPMGTDNNIYQTFFRILDGLLLLGCRPESAHQIHPHRKFLHTLGKGIVMLLGKNRRRHQIYDLLILLHCLKCRTDCNFRLAIAHIPTDQTVHDLSALHILFYRINGKHLIFCLLKRKHLFKFPLPYGILAIYETFLLLSCRIQLHQIFCD